MSKKNKGINIQNIGGYVDNELSVLEKVSVLKAMEKYQEIMALEMKVREQKEAIKAAFLLNLLDD